MTGTPAVGARCMEEAQRIWPKSRMEMTKGFQRRSNARRDPWPAPAQARSRSRSVEGEALAGSPMIL